MARRPKVQRLPSGIPVSWERCNVMGIEHPDELLSDRCRRPRKRGSSYCAQHMEANRGDTRHP